ncbi:hypothetical protein CAPTEDRAFT_124269 [Capitella teleta]|uniref:5'-nucleotidase n=1 Tax=Capitella teleta TaxID=283909 RepID=R7T630_CAPTE|nr:hypothetical protein CAPTEDRAFT_124269 [Capitella teleta]|eukprot:ELT88815.1 hypothetical protein CAPTEDRAFT_124269 [Capitella teleta]
MEFPALLFLVLCLIFFVNCDVEFKLDGDFKLTILHTNDVHARFRDFTSRGAHCQDTDGCYGGAARRMTKIKEIRRKEENVLLLDAGDQFQGTVWFYVHQGTAAANFMQMLRYDAMALGNHEFDRGVEGLVPFLKNTTFPVLAANIDARFEPSLQGLFLNSTIVRFSDRNVGIIGYTTQETTFISNTGFENNKAFEKLYLAVLGELIFGDVKEAIRREVTLLKENGVDVIIALGHAGIQTDVDIARNVDGVDIVIGGHTNTFLYTGNPPTSDKVAGPYPLVVSKNDGGSALVVQGFAFGKYLGELEVMFKENGDFRWWRGNPILLDDSIEKDPEVEAEVAHWGQRVQELHAQTVGSTSVFLDGSRRCRLEECTMGNLLTDAATFKHRMRNGTSVAIAMINGGSLRASIAKGERSNMTFGDLISICPFGNTMDMIEIKGKHLLEALEHSVVDYDVDLQHGKFLQVSGLRVKYDLSKPNRQRVCDVKVQCTSCDVTEFYDLDLDTTYKVMTSSFLVDGGDGYSMLSDNLLSHHIFGDVDLDVLIEYIEQMSPISTTVDDRIDFISDGDPCSLHASAPSLQASLLVLIFCVLFIKS